MGAVSYGPGRGLDPGVGPVGAPPGEHRVAVGVDCDLGLERVASAFTRERNNANGYGHRDAGIGTT
jgi:hypothetical protein